MGFSTELLKVLNGKLRNFAESVPCTVGYSSYYFVVFAAVFNRAGALLQIFFFHWVLLVLHQYHMHIRRENVNCMILSAFFGFLNILTESFDFFPRGTCEVVD